MISTWKEKIAKINQLALDHRNHLLEIPLAKGKFVNVEFVFEDSIFHSFHHRGQIILMFRLLGKTVDDIHPREVNVDYLNYIFKMQPQLIFEEKPSELNI